MNEKLTAVAAVVLLLGGGVAGGAALGVGPVDTLVDSAVDGTLASSQSGDDPGGGGEAGGGGSGGGASADDGSAGSGPPPFGFAIDSIEKCGQTCRDVTATITNKRNESVDGVVVVSRIYAGEDKLWEGNEELGTLAPNESATRTNRVKLGFVDAAKIKNNDGYVTVETTIRWDGGSMTFEERRKVA